MKGDGDIKKIAIKFLGIGNNSRYQVNVIIYDNRCNVLFKGRTKNGALEVILPKMQVYKLEASFLNEKTRFVFVSKDDRLVFRLKNNLIDSNVNTHNVTFLLSDYYYNLPIEKGEIILWQK